MSATVAYAGTSGAFAEEACLTFLPDHEPVAQACFAAVAAAVAQGSVACGMLPLENSIAGPVPGVADLIEEARLMIAARHRLPIRLHLLGSGVGGIDQLCRVRSHPMALAQCGAALSRLGLAGEPNPNAAVAAAELSASGDPKLAVLASDRAAARFGLKILLRDLQDRADNRTTFGVIVRAVMDDQDS